FHMGGRGSERKKWIHCGRRWASQTRVLARRVNRMQEALTLFDSICNSRWFVKMSIILFLNKIDLFAEKLPRSLLVSLHCDNYDAACDPLLHQFVSLNQSAATKRICAHYTCATDTQQIKFVLSAFQVVLLQRQLRECGPFASPAVRSCSILVLRPSALRPTSTTAHPYP
ncbi:G protein alpha subunit CIG1, partial [Mycena latifolia]